METMWSFDNSKKFFSNKESFIPMTQKQQEKLLEFWNEERLNFIQEELNLQGDYVSGFVTKEDISNRMCEIQCDIFKKVQERFEQEYWISPIKTQLK